MLPSPHLIVESVTRLMESGETFFQPSVPKQTIASVRWALQEAVMFDFCNSGIVSISQAQSMFAVDLLKDGLFILPYPVTAVRWGRSRMLLLMQNRDRLDRLSAITIYPAYNEGGVPGNDKPVGYLPCALLQGAIFTKTDDTLVIDGKKQAATRVEFENIVHLSTDQPLSTQEELDAGAKEIRDAVILLSLLYRRGATERSTASVKASLNAKRAKTGKPPIRDHHVVKIRFYAINDEPGPGAGIKHASPIPHWRRAHDRHLQSGKVIPIEEMMVNFDGDDVMKPVYEAIRAKLRRGDPVPDEKAA